MRREIGEKGRDGEGTEICCTFDGKKKEKKKKKVVL